MLIVELTLLMGESTLKVLISLKPDLCIVVDVCGQLQDSECCMFTLTADDGICAKCRPAESLLRQRQAGRQMQGELLVVCSFGYGGGSATHQAVRAPLAVNRDRRR